MRGTARRKLAVEAYVNGVYSGNIAEVNAQTYFWEVKPNTPYGEGTHDAPTGGLIYYDKDQWKLLEAAREYADEHDQDRETASARRQPVPQPVPYPVPWWWPE